MKTVSPEQILEVLARHGVDYVVIGAVGAILQGVPLSRTLDLDVAASHGKANLEKLSAALRDMDAKLRLGSPAGVEVLDAPIDDRMLRGVYVVTTMTRFEPEPPGGPAPAVRARSSCRVAGRHRRVQARRGPGERCGSPDDPAALHQGRRPARLTPDRRARPRRTEWPPRTRPPGPAPRYGRPDCVAAIDS